MLRLGQWRLGCQATQGLTYVCAKACDTAGVAGQCLGQIVLVCIGVQRVDVHLQARHNTVVMRQGKACSASALMVAFQHRAPAHQL